MCQPKSFNLLIVHCQLLIVNWKKGVLLMKYKRSILLISAFIISYIYIFHPLIEKKITKDGFKEKVIRFHIRANSDKEEDQELKLLIRDKILEVMGEKFKDTNSLGESRIVIKENIDEMKSIAENIISTQGKDYEVNISLKEDNFPLRKYGNMIFPQGQYEALIIEIGQGEGQNWWCVMFPPICFVDITHSVAYAAENNELGEYIQEQNPPLILKSAIGEFFRKKKDNSQSTMQSSQLEDSEQRTTNLNLHPKGISSECKANSEQLKSNVGNDALVVPYKNIILMEY